MMARLTKKIPVEYLEKFKEVGYPYKTATYAKIIDWVADIYGIFISFDVYYTFAFRDRGAFVYTIYTRYNRQDAKFTEIKDTEMGSFPLEAAAAFNKVLELIKEGKYVVCD